MARAAARDGIVGGIRPAAVGRPTWSQPVTCCGRLLFCDARDDDSNMAFQKKKKKLGLGEEPALWELEEASDEVGSTSERATVPNRGSEDAPNGQGPRPCTVGLRRRLELVACWKQ